MPAGPGLRQRCNERPEVPGSVRRYLTTGIVPAAGGTGAHWFHFGMARHCCRECAEAINGLGIVGTAIAAVVIGVLLLVTLT